MSRPLVPWRCVVTEALDGAANMALDAAMLRIMEERLSSDEAVRPVLRLYSWSPASVSTGRHQTLSRACDIDECKRAGVDVVKRPTGGRGVLHQDEVTFAVVAPATGPFGGDGVTRASAAVAGALVYGLRLLGVPVDAAKGVPPLDPRQKRGACFTATSRQEIVVAGRKLCGSAQFRGRVAFLQHGSLPLTFDVERQGRLLGAAPRDLADKALGLVDCLAQVPTVGEIHDALRVGFATELGATFEACEPDAAERERCRMLDRSLRADPSGWQPAKETRCSVPS